MRAQEFIQEVKARYEMTDLDPWTFDQTPAGWRGLPSSARQADALNQYIDRYVKDGQFVGAPEGVKTVRPYILYWHLGQVLTQMGRNAMASRVMRQALDDSDPNWNAYVMATISFLRKDRKDFDHWAPLARGNEETIKRLTAGWGRPYKQAYAGQQGVAEGQLDPYRLERLDPQTRRVLIRMGDHKEPGSWLSASEAYAMSLGLQYKNRDPRGWEQEVQHYVDLYRQYSGQGVREGSLNEYRDQLWAWIQSKFPSTQWPEYVQRDFLYAKAKGNQNRKDLEDFSDEIQRDFGRVRWRLEKLPITLDIFTPKTQRMIKEREGGSSNPYQVPKDAERHALQQKMIQQKGVSQEPIIVAKLSNGYDLIEGWHRTIQHLKAYPQGYTGPAWVGYGATYTSESKQGVQEVKILSKVKGKGSEPGQLPRFGRPIAPGEETRYLGTKVADWQGREIWRDYLGGQLSYHLFDPDTRTVIVTTFGSRYKNNPRSYIIHGLYAAPGNPVRAAEFYRGLVRDLGLTLISDRKQSPGGNRVWQQLEQFPDVEVYGYDTATGEVKNFGAKDVEMYTVPSAAVAGSKEMQRVARDLRLVATAR